MLIESDSIVSDDIKRVWMECLKIMENKLSKLTFEMCLKKSIPISLEGETLNIGVTNKFAKDWLTNKHQDLINQTFRSLIGKDISLSFLVDNSDAPISEEQTLRDNTTYSKNNVYESLLNPNYTFDTFVIGSSNHFASAAALAVAESPAKAYNPLFIYGGVGLGKTHLMHAIGRCVLKNNQHLRVVYASTEKFTNELINAIKDQRTIQFRNKYRHVDVLLIDDIQFLINKETTQEEFFHTFNDLHGANKQIVITSDRPPGNIPTLEERLKSRFEWGLIADIQTPDIETREAILRKKAELERVSVPYEVISFIAEKVKSNIRELEGALVRTVAFSSLNKCDITLETCRNSLKNILPEEKNKLLTISLIKQKVSDYFEIKQDQLIGDRRDQRFVFPRQVAMYLSRELIGASYPDIGKEFGGKDHTTVMHSYKKISENMKNNQIENVLENIKNLLTDYSK